MYKVESGIKLPPKQCGGQSKSSRLKYPFNRMGIGDSFFVRCSHKKSPWNGITNSQRQSSNIHGACKSYRISRMLSINEFKITIRRVPFGIRIWRVK